MTAAEHQPYGPVDIAVIGFAGSLEDTGIAGAIAEAVTAGSVRVLDVLIVEKDAEGAVTMVDAETTEGSADLLGFPADLPDMVGEEDARAIAAEMAPGDSVLLIVWENLWAARIAGAVQAAGGQVLTLDRIPAADIRSVLDAFATTEGDQ